MIGTQLLYGALKARSARYGDLYPSARHALDTKYHRLLVHSGRARFV
jgi:hypothetical protein